MAENKNKISTKNATICMRNFCLHQKSAYYTTIIPPALLGSIMVAVPNETLKILNYITNPNESYTLMHFVTIICFSCGTNFTCLEQHWSHKFTHPDCCASLIVVVPKANNQNRFQLPPPSVNRVLMLHKYDGQNVDPPLVPNTRHDAQMAISLCGHEAQMVISFGGRNALVVNESSQSQNTLTTRGRPTPVVTMFRELDAHTAEIIFGPNVRAPASEDTTVVGNDAPMTQTSSLAADADPTVVGNNAPMAQTSSLAAGTETTVSGNHAPMAQISSLAAGTETTVGGHDVSMTQTSSLVISPETKVVGRDLHKPSNEIFLKNVELMLKASEFLKKKDNNNNNESANQTKKETLQDLNKAINFIEQNSFEKTFEGKVSQSNQVENKNKFNI